MPRIISAPMDVAIATHRGFDVCFAGLSLAKDLPLSPFATAGGRRLELRLRSIANSGTRWLDSEFYGALESWAAKAENYSEDQAGPASHFLTLRSFHQIRQQMNATEINRQERFSNSAATGIFDNQHHVVIEGDELIFEELLTS